MVNQPQRKNVSLKSVLAALLDEQNPFPHSYLRHLSDLEHKDLAALESVWPNLSANRRLQLLEDLAEIAQNDTLVMFDNVARMALTDPEARVRAAAVDMLDQDEDPRLAEKLLEMLRDDPAPAVRAEAAAALGPFVYRGELEELDQTLHHRIEDHLLQVLAGNDEKQVRRNALEALGYSGRTEVPDLLRSAYTSGDDEWLVSALSAMGRSADTSWEPDVKRMLRHGNSEVQFEAVRAAGELSLDSTRRILLDLLEEEVQDSEVRSAIIWSLSQIGGEEVRETLENLQEETEDDDEFELLLDALDNLTFTEDVGGFDLFDFDELGKANRPIDDIQSYLDSAGELDEGQDAGNRTTGEGEDEVTKGTGRKRHPPKNSSKD